MKKLLNILAKVLIGILFFYAFVFLVIGWVQAYYRPLVLSCFILVAIVIAAVFYIIKIEKELRVIKKEKDSSSNKEIRYLDRIKHLERDLDELNKANEVNASEIESQNTANSISTAIEQNEQLEQEVTIEGPTVISEPQAVIACVETEEEYYSSPNSNGEFDRGHAKKQMTDDSFYKIIWKQSEAKGQLELLDKRDYSRLLGGFKSDCLYPVCEVANNKNDGKTITMLSSGSVVLHENKWVVENGQKIKINIE